MESKTKLLDQMRHVLRLKHMSVRMEEASVHWATRCMLFHHKRHPADMGAAPRATPDRSPLPRPARPAQAALRRAPPAECTGGAVVRGGRRHVALPRGRRQKAV
jgi:hypothetical protein